MAASFFIIVLNEYFYIKLQKDEDVKLKTNQ
jgi:hypothetical protein